MRQWLIVIWLITVSGLVYGQQFVGSVKYIESFNWIKTYDSLDFYSEEYKKGLILKYNQPITYRSFKLITNVDTSHYSELHSSDKHYYRHFWRKDSVIISGELKKKDFHLHDRILKRKWVIKDEIKEIIGHICMKAVFYDPARRQNVVAWFALDIPGPGGPENYVNLPGFVLEVDINSGTKVIRATELKRENISFIALPKKRSKAFSYDKFNKFIGSEISRLINNRQYPYHIIQF